MQKMGVLQVINGIFIEGVKGLLQKCHVILGIWEELRDRGKAFGVQQLKHIRDLLGIQESPEALAKEADISLGSTSLDGPLQIVAILEVQPVGHLKTPVVAVEQQTHGVNHDFAELLAKPELSELGKTMSPPCQIY